MKKEIEKEIIKFDLKRLKGKKVVVNCRTKEQFGSFVNWANSLGVDFGKHNHWEKYKEDSCLMITLDLLWTYGNIELFEKEDYEIISYEEALLKESKEQLKEISEETSKQTNTQVIKQPKIKEEFISKVKTEKIGIRINSEEELSIWFNFLNKHSDKALNRLKRSYRHGYIYSNNSAFENIMEFNTDDGYYEDKGFKIYNFKDICEEGKGIPKVKHSYESAIKEAQRLCKKEAPTEVYVLEIKKTFKSEVVVKEI